MGNFTVPAPVLRMKLDKENSKHAHPRTPFESHISITVGAAVFISP